jgi:capsid protein
LYDWKVVCFLQRVWNFIISKAIVDGSLEPAPLDENGRSEFYKTYWLTPRYDSIDVRSEHVAEAHSYSMGTTSLTELCKKRGRDAEELLTEKFISLVDKKDVDTNAS